MKKNQTINNQIFDLLNEVKYSKSISKASKKLNIPLSDFRKIINSYEYKNNKKLLESSSGGLNGGGTRLTNFGLKVLVDLKEKRSKLKPNQG